MGDALNAMKTACRRFHGGASTKTGITTAQTPRPAELDNRRRERSRIRGREAELDRDDVHRNHGRSRSDHRSRGNDFARDDHYAEDCDRRYDDRILDRRRDASYDSRDRGYDQEKQGDYDNFDRSSGRRRRA